MAKTRMNWEITKKSDVWPANYKTGMWAFTLHRITGLALVFYILLHIIVISTSIQGAQTFNNVMDTLHSPFFLILDLGLVAAVLYHGLNGVRLLLFDAGIGVRNQAALFWVAMAVAVVGFIYAALKVLPLLAH